MRALHRFAFLVVAAQLATACSTVAEFNPFDDDPNGPPPAPKMWSGPNERNYQDGQEITDTRQGRGQDMGNIADTRGGRSGNVEASYVTGAAADASPPNRKLAAAKSGRAAYDKSYGTSTIDEAPLPPPSPANAAPEMKRVSSRAVDPVPARVALADPAPENANSALSGERTLTTKGSTATPAPTPVSEKKVDRTLVHTVKPGDDLASIADEYHVREVDIIQANAMRPPYKLAKNQQLRIPVIGEANSDPKPGTKIVAGDPVPVPKPDPLNGRKTPPAAPGAAPDTKPDATTKVAKAEDGGRFIWPVSGKIVAAYGAHGGGLYNEGINIAVPSGTAVHAASGGVVRYAGNELRGYGNLVLIEHDGGFVTAYAHNDSLSVKRGDKVSQGQVIAKSGATGNVKSPQLHFEIRKGAQSVDPSKYLTS